MAWLKMDTDLLGHPKLKRFARGLGIPEAAAAGHLFALWGWAMNYAEDGNLSGFCEDDIACAAGWPGDAQKFLYEALHCGIMGPGFLEENESGEIVIYRWEDHMGSRFERRKKQAERMREYRERQSATKKDKNISPCTHNVHSTYASREHNVSITCAVRREERRGEEKRGDPPPTPPGGVRAGVESPAPKSSEAGQPETSLPAERPQESGGARPNTGGKEADPPAAFAVFWAAYPRKVQKQTALKAWRTLVKQGASDADILNAAGAYQTASTRKHTPPDKIMHPATFLREDRWRDWLPPDGASYREAMSAASGSYADAAKRYKGVTEKTPMTYAEAVERFRGPGAVTVDIAPGEWREGAGK